MAQNVSDDFIKTIKSAQKTPEFRVLVSWEKELSDTANFFCLDSSELDVDILKGSSEVVALYDKYNYIDESKFVKNFEISRKVSNYAWGVITAKASLTLNNRSGRFLPGGELGANLSAGRPVKIMVGYNGELVTVFTGFLGVPKINIVDGTVEFDAFDTMTYFADRKTSTQFFDRKSLKEIIDSLMNEQGFGLNQYSISENLNRVYPFFYSAGGSLVGLFNEISRNETALISADENGFLKFVKINDLIKRSDRTWDFNYSNMTGLEISNSEIINSVKVKSEYYREVGIGDVYNLDHNEIFAVPPKSDKSFWFEYRDGVDISLDVEAREQEFRSSPAGGSIITNIKTKGYNFLDKYKLQVTNTTNTTIYLTKFDLFGRIVNKFTETPVEVTNASSAEKYGINPDSSTGFFGEPLEYDTSLYGTVIEAGLVVKSNYDVLSDVGNSILSMHSEPNRQFKVSNFMVPHLQVGDVVGLNVEDLKSEYDCVVLGSVIKGGVEANFRQELHLQIIPEWKLFRLDISHLDSGDILDY